MIWERSWRADPLGARIADRHYNRHAVGSAQFVPPGRCVVLVSPAGDALWVTSWQLPEFSHHAWPGAWVNSTYRNESGARASDQILEALAATRYIFGDPPAEGIVSFVDPRAVPPIRRRRHRCAVGCLERVVVGYCFERAGFTHVGFTKDASLWVWQLRPELIPPAAAPSGEFNLQTSTP